MLVHNGEYEIPESRDQGFESRIHESRPPGFESHKSNDKLTFLHSNSNRETQRCNGRINILLEIVDPMSTDTTLVPFKLLLSIPA